MCEENYWNTMFISVISIWEFSSKPWWSYIKSGLKIVTEENFKPDWDLM